MTFNKFAGGGEVDLEIRFDANTKLTKVTVIGHRGGATCANSQDEETIRKFLTMTVPGFDASAEIEFVEEGPTSELYQERRKPVKAKPQEEPSMFDENSGTSKKNKGRQMYDAGGQGV